MNNDKIKLELVNKIFDDLNGFIQDEAEFLYNHESNFNNCDKTSKQTVYSYRDLVDIIKKVIKG